ncbi:DNA-binding response regulator, partial [Corynebacterium propinquum]
MTHVLVVEDDLTTAREIELALIDYGFSVTT